MPRKKQSNLIYEKATFMQKIKICLDMFLMCFGTIFAILFSDAVEIVKLKAKKVKKVT